MMLDAYATFWDCALRHGAEAARLLARRFPDTCLAMELRWPVPAYPPILVTA